MSNQKSFEVLAIVSFAIAVTVVFVSILATPKAEANPIGFSCAAYGPQGVATTSVKFMTPGTATSTLVYDTYCIGGTNQSNPGNSYATDYLTLLTQLSASSTATILNTSVEYSQDGVDWYQDNYIASTTTAGNFVPLWSITVPNSFTWTFASSTLNGVANTGNRVGKVVQIYAPTRYVRVVYTLTGNNGAVWGSLLPIKENK